MAGKLAQILNSKASLVDGKLSADIIPVGVGLTTDERNKLTDTPTIVMSATEPSNPATGLIWIDIS